ncbi:MAG: insulinase family protein [Bacteroidetes bacterium]|nr:insulinase family protein [Bacteroidota bacterium]
MFKTVLLFSLILLLNTSNAFASKYSQQGFYDVEHYILENGMNIILKPRHTAKNVSIRLKVDVGHNHFKCGKKETAHYLEHLLFAGTSKHSESELDDLIALHGGNFNASTHSEFTQYKIDINSLFFETGLSVLHEIITDSELSDESIQKTKDIIYREDGGKLNFFRRKLHQNEFIASASKLALNDLLQNASFLCNDIDNISNITRPNITNAFEAYYIPKNMTLSIVGDFKLTDAKKLIEKTMRLIPKSNKPKSKNITIPKRTTSLDSNHIYYGKFDPIVDSESIIGVYFLLPSRNHKDSFVLDILEQYFKTQLFNTIRTDEGLAYAPSADAIFFEQYGVLALTSDSEIEDAEKTLKLIHYVTNELLQGKVKKEKFEEAKLKILIGAASAIEKNADFAEYYAENVFDLINYGKIINYEDTIENVTLNDFKRVAKKYLNASNRVVLISSPTLSYTQFYLLILISLISIIFMVTRIVLKNKKHEDSL